ncbi:UNVERIFIED_CONTAM: hypothetical protein K2H54_010561 [Gekko kuhli]
MFVNLTCALLVHEDAPEGRLRWAVFTRALVNDTLFILCAVLLAYCMCRLSKTTSANVYLESKPSFPSPVRAQPSFPSPVRAQPSFPSPVRAQPSFPSPVRAQPSFPSPVRAQPSFPSPVRAQPSFPSPVRAQPSFPSPVRAQPSFPSPVRAQPSFPSPVRAQPSFPSPVRAQPSFPSPVRAQPSFPSPVRAQPSFPSPVRAQPSFPSPVRAQPSFPSPVRAQPSFPSPGTSVCQALLVGSVVILLCSSRAFYNLVTLAISPDRVPSPFNYGWDNLSDQARGEEVSSEEYVVFGVVLFLWELVPTVFVVLFFRAQRMTQNLTPAGMINSHSFSSRAYFFDNPRRYDSDDDLPRLGGGRGEGGSLATPQNPGWYGSLTENENSVVIPPLSTSTADAAPLLFAHGATDPKNQHNFHLTPHN